MVVVRAPASRDADIGTCGAPLERPASLRAPAPARVRIARARIARAHRAMEPPPPPDSPATTDDPSKPVALALLVAVFGALVAQQAVCAEQHVCIDHGTCFAVRNESFSCAFRTSITPAAYRMLNFTSQDEALQALQRGVCAPGMRQSIDAYGPLHCVRRRPLALASPPLGAQLSQLPGPCLYAQRILSSPL